MRFKELKFKQAGNSSRIGNSIRRALDLPKCEKCGLYARELFLSDLSSFSKRDILKLKNLGPKAILGLEEALKDVGIDLETGVPFSEITEPYCKECSEKILRRSLSRIEANVSSENSTSETAASDVDFTVGQLKVIRGLLSGLKIANCALDIGVSPTRVAQIRDAVIIRINKFFRQNPEINYPTGGHR